jgi:hypothetical protein
LGYDGRFDILLDPEHLSRIDAEASLVGNVEPPVVREFWAVVMRIVRRIVREKLSTEQQKIIYLFLNRSKIRRIAELLSKSQRAIYYRYQVIAKKISRLLAEDEEFRSLAIPPSVRRIVGSWTDRENASDPRISCPVCNRMFDGRVAFKNHLINHRIVWKYAKRTIPLHDEHIEFIESQERMIDRCYRDNGGYFEKWAVELAGSRSFYLGQGWIYRHCRELPPLKTSRKPI